MNINEILSRGKITKTELQELIDLKTPAKQIIQKEKFKIPFLNFKFNKLLLFKILIFVVFCFASVMTITYNYYGFQKTMDGFKPMLASIIFVFFAVICFEATIFILINKKIFWITKTILSIFFISMFLVSLFIIGLNILTGQFDKYQNILIAEKKASNDNSYTLFNEYEKQESELKKEYDNRVSERDRQQNIYSAMDGTEKNYYNVRYTITKLNTDIQGYEKKLETLRTKKQGLLETNTITEVRKSTLYDYFFKDKEKAKQFEFLQIVLPSLVFDIISSISLGLIFFMKEEKND